MECKLSGKTSKDFEIEFETIEELEELRNSLTAMLRYAKVCESDGEKPVLLYKIKSKK